VITAKEHHDALLRRRLDSFIRSFFIFGINSICMFILLNILTTDKMPREQGIFLIIKYVWLCYIMGDLLIMFIDKRKRALHDILAGTLVICE
jgi:uncharacterized RDD family membrane protein YckC